MSVEQYQRLVNSLDREIADLEKKESESESLREKIADKRKKRNDAYMKLQREMQDELKKEEGKQRRESSDMTAQKREETADENNHTVTLGEDLLHIKNGKNLVGDVGLSKDLQQYLRNIKNIKSSYVNVTTPTVEQKGAIDSITAMSRLQGQLVSSCSGLLASSISKRYQKIAASLTKRANSIWGNHQSMTALSVSNMIFSYQHDVTHKVQFPIQQMLSNIDFSPLYGIFESLKGFDLSKHRKKLNEIVNAETYDARWFPHALCIGDNEMIARFWEILKTTRKSKNRIKKIDHLIFETYDKKRIENIKKTWRQKAIPEHKMRMMHQAVQAYHRKEYAITVVMLSTLWEGIIYDKVNDLRGKNGKRTKKNFSRLIEQTEYDELFCSFFDEYIMYDCRSVEDVKEDVPGRNSSAHSWYSKYPSRKAGLNAILFTDFLLNLEPIKEDEEHG